MTRTRLVLAGTLLCVAVATAAAAGLARNDSEGKLRPETATRQPGQRSVAIPPGSSIVAHSRLPAIRIFERPSADASVRTLRNPNAGGDPLVFLVEWSRPRWTWPRWVRVRLPVRPNGSAGWIRASDVRFVQNPFRVEIDLTAHEITAWRGARRVVHEKIGVGLALTPTPVGKYFITELINVVNPTGLYGPHAFGTSAYSTVLTNFGGGPGQIGIHGTNRPDLLGTDVSHGCIRLRNEAITKLARTLPLGTPVLIRR